MMVLFGLGFDLLPVSRWMRCVVYSVCWATVAACLAYFLVELAFLYGILPPGTPFVA